MMLSDVHHLIAAEEGGKKVISWYARATWDLRKHSVGDTETALRISKLLRDNRHTALLLLLKVSEEGHHAFLSTYLELGFAEFDVEFVGLRVEDHLTKYDQISHTKRQSKYVVEQKARRLRVAFESIRDYGLKENRNEFRVSSAEIESRVQAAITAPDNSTPEIRLLN